MILITMTFEIDHFHRISSKVCAITDKPGAEYSLYNLDPFPVAALLGLYITSVIIAIKKRYFRDKLIFLIDCYLKLKKITGTGNQCSHLIAISPIKN